MATSRKRGGSRAKTGVFLVDDHEMVEAGVRTIVGEAPENDMVFVGSSKTFGPEVHEAIRQSGAEVALVDIMDTSRNPIGLRTIREVRRQLGSRVGIIAYTIHPEFREPALTSGADKFLLKGATNDNHRLAVRTCKDHETISGIELFLAERDIHITVTSPGNPKCEHRFTLGRDAFALLYYLAEERARGQIDWLSKEDRDEKRCLIRFGSRAFGLPCGRDGLIGTKTISNLPKTYRQGILPGSTGLWKVPCKAASS